jgi:hypothetical protein
LVFSHCLGSRRAGLWRARQRREQRFCIVAAEHHAFVGLQGLIGGQQRAFASAEVDALGFGGGKRARK